MGRGGSEVLPPAHVISPPFTPPPHPPQVLQPASLAGRQGGGFAPAHVITEVSLLYKRVMITAGRRPVRAGMRGGLVGGSYLPPPAHRGGGGRSRGSS